MRRIFNFLLYPLYWIQELIWDWQEYGFKDGVWQPLIDAIDDFFL